jgi:hypothetical protein
VHFVSSLALQDYNNRTAMAEQLEHEKRLFCFDFDDTVATTCHRVWTTEGPLSTSEYAAKKFPLHPSEPFREFHDVDGCDLRPAPFLEVFAQALAVGSPVAVITARANDPEDFRRLVARAATMAGGELHGRVHLYCCNAPSWSLPGKTREERKCAAILDFVSRYPEAVSVGFSDDDPQNILAVQGLFRHLAVTVPHVKWRTYACGAAANADASAAS